MNEPRWRTILCWGVVITYLTLPLLVFVLYIVASEMRSFHFEEYATKLAFLKPFYESITALAFGLSGLHSFDRFVQQKNGSDRRGIHEAQIPLVKPPVSPEQPKSKRSD